MDRRTFIKGSVAPAAALALAGPLAAQQRDPAPGIIDTNINLFTWPFRRLKYGDTAALVEKLRRHRIHQAWAGSYEALLHKNIDAVNAALAEECHTRGDGLLVPFGTVHPVWPDWEHELRRCHEVHRMPGIRLYPSYQNYTLEHPSFTKLLAAATERGMIVQIAIDMEDSRVHHPIIDAPSVNVTPLIAVLKNVLRARVQLVNAGSAMRGMQLRTLIEQTNLSFDIADVEGNGGVGRLLEGNHWHMRGQMPLGRLLFGTNAPFFPVESALLKMFESPLTLEQSRAIMNENARRLISAATG